MKRGKDENGLELLRIIKIMIKIIINIEQGKLQLLFYLFYLFHFDACAQ